MNYIKKNTNYVALTTLFFLVGLFVVLPALPSTEVAKETFVASVSAFEEGGGEGGCCGGGEGGDEGSTPDPDAPEPDAPAPTPTPTPPVCTSSSASPSTINVGETTEIHFSSDQSHTTSGVDIRLNPGNIKYTGPGSFIVTPTTNTTYTVTVKNNDGTATCPAVVVTVNEVSAPPVCDSFEVNRTTVPNGGGDVDFSWETTNATAVYISGMGGGFALDDDSYIWRVDSDTTFVLTASKPGEISDTHCQLTVTVDPPTTTKQPISCSSNVTFSANPASFNYLGGTTRLSWTTFDAVSVKLDGVTVNKSHYADRSVTATKTFTLAVTGDSTTTGNTVLCPVTVIVTPYQDTGLSCNDVSFNSNPSSPVAPGTVVNLSWVFTGNVTSATIDNGIGDAFARSSVPVTINNTTTFNATIYNATTRIVCPYTVTTATTNPTAPDISIDKRDAIDKDDSQTVPVGGTAKFEIIVTNTGNENLVNVVVTDPLEANCNLTIGNLAIGAVHTYTCDSTNVQSNFTNVANVTGNSAVDNQSVDATNSTDVTVGGVMEISCENNVSFTADDYSLPSGGADVILTWVTTGIDSVSINGVASTNSNDSETVRVNADATYNMSIYVNNQIVDSCPLVIDVASGGGGGGSSSPKCDLDISDDKIKTGEEVTLTWDTTRAREVRIEDNHGNVLLDSDDNDDFDGKMTIKPTKDTEYTLFSIKGSKEKKCEVEVDVENKITVFSSRTQDPRVAGISLTQVPYTGFEAGPALTMIFYALLTIWGLFVAYIFAVRRDFIGGVSLAGAHDHVSYTDMSTNQAVEDTEAESEAESYVHAVAHTEAPVNLPIATPVIGYAAVEETDEVDESIEMTELENRAHAQKVLLSSDAMRFFMNATEAGESRNEKLDAALAQAKASFPSEDGWVALNLARIETLISDDVAVEKVEAETEAITGGSLAEAIVAGNVVAAYQMIAHRPMIALADAASDLDAVYRSRKGETVNVSDMLTTSAAAVSVEKLEEAITALTGALDGTYDSEAEAVKMAILKAVQATS